MRHFVEIIRTHLRAPDLLRRFGVLALIGVGAFALISFGKSAKPWGAPWAGTATPTGTSSLAEESDVERVDRALDRVFSQAGIDRAAIRGKFVPMVTEEDSFARFDLDLPVPRSVSLHRLNAGVSEAAEDAGASILDVIELGDRPGAPTGLEILLGIRNRATHRLSFQREKSDPGLASDSRTRNPHNDGGTKGTTRIAIVIDDLGFSLDALPTRLLALEGPLTFGVIAGLKYSTAFAESAEAHGHDVILHVPMEPLDRSSHDPGRNAIEVGLDPLENLRRFRAHLNGLAAYSGVSNHMGSRVTSNRETMQLVLEELRQHDRTLFFLDSKTTPFSVVSERGRRVGVRVLVNNLFLDGDPGEGVDPPAQVRRIEEIARRRGTAIAIGHVGEETVAALEEAAVRWRESGIRMVTLSELAGNQRKPRTTT